MSKKNISEDSLDEISGELSDFGSRFGDRFFVKLEEFIESFGDAFQVNPRQIVKLETNVGEHIISTRDLSMVSLYDINGLRSIISQNEFSEKIDIISSSLKPYMKKSGHYMQFVMEYDPTISEFEVRKNTDIMRTTSKNIGLDIDFIFDDWANKVKDYVSYEKVYLALWTRPDVLSSVNRKDAMNNQKKRATQQSLYSKKSINVEAYLEELINQHNTFLNGIETGFETAKILIRKMTAHEAVTAMREQIDKEATSKFFKPYLNGDKIVLRIKNKMDSMSDLENVMYPKIASQIIPRELEEEDSRVVRSGDNYHYPMALEIPPTEIQSFNALLSSLNNKDFPWRISFGINGGTPSFGFKKILSALFKKTSNDSYLLNNAITQIEEYEKEDFAIVGFKATFDTWVNVYEDDALKKLSSSGSELIASIQGWGNAEATDLIGNPTLGFLSTISGISDSLPSNGAAAPIADVIKMMPITRPSSIWKTGSTIFRTACGKLFPYQQGSSKQTAWIDISLAPMGFGKSVMLNTLNFSFLFEPGIKNLPWVSMLDIGPSSKGVIDLIRMGLREELRHQAIYHRLRLDKNESINPCDTPLGLREPFKSQKMFLVNLLTLFGTPIGSMTFPSGIDDIANRAIDLAYQQFSDGFTPKLYTNGVLLNVDEALEKHEFSIDDETTWWEVVDFLFDKDEMNLASKAQTMAVPLITDIASFFNNQIITKLYGDKVFEGGSLIQFFWNSCISAVNNYGLLSQPTKLDFSEARIISLDLDEVAIKGVGAAERQTAVMYMLGRHIVASKFFFMEADANGILNEKYKEFHLQKIRSLRDDPKRLNYDEIHRITRAEGSGAVKQQIVADIVTAIRESRKWKLHLGLASQEIDDFPSEIRNLATSTYILGVGASEEADKIQKIYSLTNAEKTVIKNLRKPGRQGAGFLGIFKTDDGEIRQKLMNTLGSVMLWGFSSTWDDNKVRNLVTSKIGLSDGLTILSKKYPGGTVGDEALKRKMAYLERGKSVDVLTEIAEEVIDIYYRTEFLNSN